MGIVGEPLPDEVAPNTGVGTELGEFNIFHFAIAVILGFIIGYYIKRWR